MLAQYNNNGHAARYVCSQMQSCYGEPFCQSLKAAPLDALISGLVLDALKPAAIEASLALAENLEAERAALDRHWRQRLERARYEVERARRQYAAVEPENRLVARTLERDWEAALTEQARLEAEHERVKRARKEAPSAAELAAIRELSQDLPALWRAETTTQQERQTIVRLLLERVLVEVVGGHGKGSHRMPLAWRRPHGARADASRRAPDVAEHLCGVDGARRGTAPRGPRMREDRRDPQRRRMAPGQAPRHLQCAKWFIISCSNRARRRSNIAGGRRKSSVWRTNGRSASSREEIGMPQPTLYTWVQKGRLRCRMARGAYGRAKLVHADFRHDRRVEGDPLRLRTLASATATTHTPPERARSKS